MCLLLLLSKEHYQLLIGGLGKEGTMRDRKEKNGLGRNGWLFLLTCSETLPNLMILDQFR